jgi:CRP-like cAMP-binding protein
MVGASREMVSRVIKTLKSEGYISISGKQITILSTLPTTHSP